MKKRTLTKRAKVLLTIIIALILFSVIAPKSTYEMQGTITNRGEITDTTGHIWEYDTNDFRVGDTVTITFHDKNTTNRTDDIIKKLK